MSILIIPYTETNFNIKNFITNKKYFKKVLTNKGKCGIMLIWYGKILESRLLGTGESCVLTSIRR